jgi:cytochrome bd-type quinol oxidase subunit 1
MAFPWLIDWGSRLLGVDVYGVEGFYIPYFYALSDQIGANISGFLFLRKKEKSWPGAFRQYFRHPVMVASLLIICLVPVGLLIARLAGFSPTTQTYTALETIAANLCWVPPLVGWLQERACHD